MNLDRGLIKHQARTLIKGKTMSLFVISFVVLLCTSIVSTAYSAVNIIYKKDVINDAYNGFQDIWGDDEYNYSYNDSDYFDSFGDNSGYDFHNFGTSAGIEAVPTDDCVVDINTAETNVMKSAALVNLLSIISFAVMLITAPLAVALMGYYVLFIRGKQVDMDEGIKFVFKNAYKNGTFAKKLAVYLEKTLLEALLGMLLWIPGIIFGYSSYFAFEIMCDYPQLSAWQAIKLSKKMVKGNRTELFVLDLSFIPWYLLCCVLFPLIYVIPYVSTTRALYYENFRIRAIQQGRVTEDDFLTDEQKYQKYMNMNQAQCGAQYNPQYNANPYYQQGYSAPQQPMYNNVNHDAAASQPFEPVNNTEQPQEQAEQADFNDNAE